MQLRSCHMGSAFALLMRVALACAPMLPTAVPAPAIVAGTPGRDVDDAFVQTNARNSQAWPTVAFDLAETRFSRLTRITTENVRQLGLVWSYDLASSRGVEATPVVVDGVMYVTAPWSVVHALDAKTGR